MTEIRIGGSPVGTLEAGSIVNVTAEEAALYVGDGLATYVNLEDIAAHGGHAGALPKAPPAPAEPEPAPAPEEEAPPAPANDAPPPADDNNPEIKPLSSDDLPPE